MRSIKPIVRGEEIFSDYGQLPRSVLLHRYGYIAENYGPDNVADINTDLALSVSFQRSA
jgi:SET domain-containing protein 6